MASDRRSRDGDRLRRRRLPSDRTGRDQADAQQEPLRSQSQRRRTSYVPRKGSGQPRRFASDDPEFNDPPDARTARCAQQPQYREEAPQLDQYDYYEEPDDDRAFTSSAVPPSRRERGRPAPASRRSRDHYPEDDQYRLRRSQDIESEDDYSDQFDDSFIDEDDWYEEEIAAGAARSRSSRARGRSARTTPRPSISLPRPNLPRPTVPVKVREAAIVQDQNAIILCGALLLSVLLMALFTSNRVETLAPGFATHISASGLQESIQSESALWQLPLMAGALLLMNAVLAWFIAQRSQFLSRLFLITVAIVHVLIWVAFVRIAY